MRNKRTALDLCVQANRPWIVNTLCKNMCTGSNHQICINNLDRLDGSTAFEHELRIVFLKLDWFLLQSFLEQQWYKSLCKVNKSVFKSAVQIWTLWIYRVWNHNTRQQLKANRYARSIEWTRGSEEIAWQRISYST